MLRKAEIAFPVREDFLFGLLVVVVVVIHLPARTRGMATRLVAPLA